MLCGKATTKQQGCCCTTSERTSKQIMQPAIWARLFTLSVFSVVFFCFVLLCLTQQTTDLEPALNEDLTILSVTEGSEGAHSGPSVTIQRSLPFRVVWWLTLKMRTSIRLCYRALSATSVYRDPSVCRDTSVYRDPSVCRDTSVYRDTSVCRDHLYRGTHLYAGTHLYVGTHPYAGTHLYTGTHLYAETHLFTGHICNEGHICIQGPICMQGPC